MRKESEKVERCPFCGSDGKEILISTGPEIEYGCGVRKTGLRRSPKCYATQISRLQARVERLEKAEEALKAIRPLMIPSMNWTDEIGQLVLRIADEALTALEAQDE